MFAHIRVRDLDVPEELHTAAGYPDESHSGRLTPTRWRELAHHLGAAGFDRARANADATPTRAATFAAVCASTGRSPRVEVNWSEPVVKLTGALPIHRPGVWATLNRRRDSDDSYWLGFDGSTTEVTDQLEIRWEHGALVGYSVLIERGDNGPAVYAVLHPLAIEEILFSELRGEPLGISAGLAGDGADAHDDGSGRRLLTGGRVVELSLTRSPLLAGTRVSLSRLPAMTSAPVASRSERRSVPKYLDHAGGGRVLSVR